MEILLSDTIRWFVVAGVSRQNALDGAAWRFAWRFTMAVIGWSLAGRQEQEDSQEAIEGVWSGPQEARPWAQLSGGRQAVPWRRSGQAP
ncbi:hypothetical protein NUU61_003860 [Penicillium alfredii]|uniref:Uncharacterized protein n=1 Tax=Penicillium alfredii TaxID=1506179 RepID=A0A9W9KDD2_9EURO|nr:uncharacterized protein NUU61_003860 [Penicillium alfredii]KAJ5101638.1 hypothetical protein NUU61_003860 [Penicillium alfredii]